MQYKLTFLCTCRFFFSVFVSLLHISGIKMLVVRNKISDLKAQRILQIIEAVMNSVEEGTRSLF